MRKTASLALASLGLLLIVAPVWAVSSPRGTVIIGQETCFRFRTPDKGQSIQQRVDHVQDIAAKYLGGDELNLTVRSVGERRHIDVNGEFLVAVTPEDARATGHPSADSLAGVWRSSLLKAFLMSRARPAPPAVTGR
jgi:hypothetical protein